MIFLGYKTCNFKKNNIHFMKKKVPFKLLSLLVILMTTLASAQTFTVNNLKYTILSGSTAIISGYDSKPTGILNIPSTITNAGIQYTVTSIGNDTFSNCTGLTSVSIPDSVTSIGYFAFTDCTGLTSVSIPNSVTSISPYAFKNCTALKSVNVGWASPLIIDNLVFFNINLKNVALNVASPGNVDDYKKAYIWEDFASFNPVLSTKTYLLDKSILVFPNPTKDFISVSGLSQTVSYNIFSISGAKVSNGTVSNNEKIDVQSLNNGVYFMELEEGHTTKFIKK